MQIVIFGNPLDNFCTALIVPEPEMINLWAEKNDCTHLTIQQLFKDQNLVNEILRDLATVGRENGLAGYEIPKRIALVDQPFTVESGLLTPSMKVKRKAVEKSFYEILQELRKS
jgi:long-chain acyl-CoA synthetase